MNLYEFKIALFDSGYPEEFLLFIYNFNMNLEASGTLKYGVKIKLLYTLLNGEALSQFDALYAEAEGARP